MSLPTNRKALKRLPRTRMEEWRPWTHGLDVLPALTMKEHGVAVPSHQRCHAIGLEVGDCRQARASRSLYCYYHDKLQRGLTTPSVPSPDEADQRDGMALYPVWPLPADGYFLLNEVPRRMPLAG